MERARVVSVDLKWLELVTTPVFVLDARRQTVIALNQGCKTILGGTLLAAEPPIPLSCLIGEDPANLVARFVAGLPADGSRSALNLTEGRTPLIMHFKRMPRTPHHWVVTLDHRTPFFTGFSPDELHNPFMGIFQNLPIGIEIYDRDLRLIFINRKSMEWCFVGDQFYTELGEWWIPAFPDPVARASAMWDWEGAIAGLQKDPSQPQITEWRFLCRDGVYRTMRNQISKIGDHYTVVFWDVSEQRRLETDLRTLASIDMLTGVSNRRHFFEQATAVLDSLRAANAAACLFMIDIDHFKSINDNFGHTTGDHALVGVAQRCKAALRATDVLARVGGEEFMALLPETSLDKARQIARRLLHAVSSTPIPTGAGDLQLTISIGLAIAPPEALDIDLLIERADAALYQAKRSGRNRVICALENCATSKAD
jgi:diguanylate cyclase (GGDEF)-like protein